MRFQIPAAALAATLLSVALLADAPAILPVDGTIGKNLQTFTSIRLSEPAPADGVLLTVTSDDPERLLISESKESAGTKSIQLKVVPMSRESDEFWLQARGDKGIVTYTVSAPGLPSSKGAITLAPSAVLITGPYRSPSFPTTTGAAPSRIVVYSAQVDENGKYVATQMVAGGMPLSVQVTSSDPRVGRIVTSPVQIPPGGTEAGSHFQPAGAGQTTLAVSVPPGFSKSAESATLTAIVLVPGIGITSDIAIGKDLQVPGLVSLGLEAPKGGLTVTIESKDPAKLLISASPEQIGSKSINLVVPAGDLRAEYYMQALSDEGTVEYTATAAGYRTDTAKVRLAPAGVVLTVFSHGPPDRAEVQRPAEEHPVQGFYTTLSPGEIESKVAVWMVQLDPVSLRGADITVQQLRAGKSAKVSLQNSNPAVGTLEPAVLIPAGRSSAIADFKPLRLGTTTISVLTPPGFTKASNSTHLPATVQEK